MPDAAAGARGADRPFLTFRLDQRWFAVPAEGVTEVMPVPHFARVPQGPKALLGLANVRGAVLPLASLSGLLGGAGTAPTGATARAVILDGRDPVAIAVDAVGALVAVPADRIEERRAELAAEPGERLQGAFPLAGGAGVAKILDLQA